MTGVAGPGAADGEVHVRYRQQSRPFRLVGGRIELRQIDEQFRISAACKGAWTCQLQAPSGHLIQLDGGKLRFDGSGAERVALGTFSIPDRAGTQYTLEVDEDPSPSSSLSSSLADAPRRAGKAGSAGGVSSSGGGAVGSASAGGSNTTSGAAAAAGGAAAGSGFAFGRALSTGAHASSRNAAVAKPA